MDLFKRLSREVAAAVAAGVIVEPLDEIGDGEQVVGVLPRELRALWMVYTKVNREKSELAARLNQEYVALGEQPSEADIERLNREWAVHECWWKVVHQAFWNSVRVSLPKATLADRIDLRAGFRVVSVPSPQLPPCLGVIRLS